MSVGKVLACLLLVSVAATRVKAADESRYKCLNCERTTDLMCFTNESCAAEETYCYYRLIREYNTSKKPYDVDYYINYREWGCTKDLKTCEESCTGNCSKNHSKCCNADLYQLSKNYSEANHRAYQSCYYGSGSRVDFVLNCYVLVITILLLNYLVR